MLADAEAAGPACELQVLRMRCRRCDSPWARTTGADRTCPFCGQAEFAGAAVPRAQLIRCADELKWEGMSVRAIAAVTGVPRSTVHGWLRRHGTTTNTGSNVACV